MKKLLFLFLLIFVGVSVGSCQNKEKADNSLLKEEVTSSDIDEVVSKWTGIPVAKLVESEMQKGPHQQPFIFTRET